MRLKVCIFQLKSPNNHTFTSFKFQFVARGPLADLISAGVGLFQTMWPVMIESAKQLIGFGSMIAANLITTTANVAASLGAGNSFVRTELIQERTVSGAQQKITREKISEIHIHPKFDKETNENNIAILVLSKNLKFDEEHGAVKVPKQGDQLQPNEEAALPVKVVLKGGRGNRVFGQRYKNAAVAKLPVPVLQDNDCKKIFKSDPKNFGKKNAESTLCSRYCCDVGLKPQKVQGCKCLSILAKLDSKSKRFILSTIAPVSVPLTVNRTLVGLSDNNLCVFVKVSAYSGS